MSSGSVGQLEASVKILAKAVAAQAELIASLRRRIEILEQRPALDQRPDLAGMLARISK